jgi:hypothetical protein
VGTAVIDVPQPYLIAAFGVLFGAFVSTTVSKVRSDRAAKQTIVERAAEIVGTGAPVTAKDALKVVNTNATLQRAVEALQTCNDGLEAELKIVKAELDGTKIDLVAALRRITDLESAIREMTRVRDHKSERIGDANRDVAG